MDALSVMHSSEYLFAKKSMLLHERGQPWLVTACHVLAWHGRVHGCTFSMALIRHIANRVLSACVRENSVDALSGMHSSEYLFAKKTMLLHERGWPLNLCSLVHGRGCHMWWDRIGSLTSRMESYWSGLG